MLPGLETNSWKKQLVFFTNFYMVNFALHTGRTVKTSHFQFNFSLSLAALIAFVTAQKIEKGFKILVERKKGSVVIYKSVVDRQSHGKKIAKTKCFVSNALFDNLKFAKKYV